MLIKKFKCHVFTDTKNKSKFPGAKCFVYLFEDYNKYINFHKNLEVIDEFDHCILIKRNDDEVELVAKNRNGYIEFCGSATYAACTILLKELKLKNLSIKLEKKLLYSYFENNEIFLEFKNYYQLNDFLIEKSQFIHKSSGIYFKELKDKSELSNDQLLKAIISSWEKSTITIHGACFFHYDKVGSIRYFVPWHGREEDYITGSIHQYLTPFVFETKNIEEQVWYQLSSSPGILYSKINKDIVKIKGEVLYE